MNDFEYQGGDIWSLEEPDAEGYGKTVISFEFDKRNETIWVIDQSRPLDVLENHSFVMLLKEIGAGKDWKLENFTS